MTRRTGSPTAKWSLVLIVVLTIGDTRCDYLMGGHLDNKEDQPPPIQRRSDVEPQKISPEVVIQSRTASTSLDDFDSDFDLGLDLLADQSSVSSSQTTPKKNPPSSSLNPSSDNEKPEPEEPEISPRYRVPLVPYAFNGGQPFSLEKDPITGQIDFEKAPPLKVLDYSAKSPEDEVNDEANDESARIVHADSKISQSDENVGPNEINPYSPSFHDFLNLPVRYTSYDRYENAEKYPLISSSYANTKVQSGANSYNTYNHKKYHESVKASVNAHLQPSRKSHVQPTTRSTTRGPPVEATERITREPTTTMRTTTMRATTTTKPPSTTRATTTTTEATTTSTRRTTTFPAVTTWKPQRPANNPHSKYPGADYEGTLPIERLQPSVSQQSSTEPPPRYVSPPARPSSPPKPSSIETEESNNEDYDDGYEDYDRIYPNPPKPASTNDHQGDSESDSDYSYGLDFFGVGSRPSMRPSTTTEKIPTRQTSIPASSSTTTTQKPAAPASASTTRFSEAIDDRRQSTTPKIAEKRVTSMPLDSGDRYVGNFGLGAPPNTGNIDNSIPSVTSNVIYHQQPQRPGSNDHQYYARPSMGISAPGIVVKSTSNVIVPPGQDTVSFVLGNHQSVGGAGDAGGEYYPVHSGSIGAERPGISFGSASIGGNSERPGISFGSNSMSGNSERPGISFGSSSMSGNSERPGISFGSSSMSGNSERPGISFGSNSMSGNAERPGISFNSRPINGEVYPGQMIVSAGIGMSPNPNAYNQRPQQQNSMANPPFDHALVSVGLPTVGVVSPGDSQQSGGEDSNESSTPNSQDQQNGLRWPSAGSSRPQLNPQQNPQQNPPQQNSPQQESPNQHENQFGYHVVFPDDDKKPSGIFSTNENPTNPQNTEEHVIVVHESEIGSGNTLHLELGAQPPNPASSGSTTGFFDGFFETTTQRFTGKPEERLPELSESLTPPAERPNRIQQVHRPPNYNYYHHQSSPSSSSSSSSHNSGGNGGNSRPEYPRPQRVPLPPLPSSSSSSSSSSSNGGFKRRPPPLDSNLPNILPQFRPNAKVSHGHNRGDNVGTIPAGSLAHYPNTIIRRPPPSSSSHHHHHHHRPSSSRRPISAPSHLQRLNPPPLPPPPPPITALRLPTPAALVAPAPKNSGHENPSPSSDGRIPVQKRIHQGIPASLAIDERHQQSQQQIKSRLEDDSERFSAEPPQQPPRAPFFGKRSPNGGADQPEGIPRIATLQMIQQHGGDDSLIVKTNLPPPYRFTLENRPGIRHEENNSGAEKEEENSGFNSANRRGEETSEKDVSVSLPIREDEKEDEDVNNENRRGDYNEAESPVYVVYPVKGALDIRHEDDAVAEDASVVVGKYGPQRPLPPDTLLLKDSSEESPENHHQHHQHHQQIYRPSGVNFADSSSPQLASDFPYPLERPDPSIFTSQLREKPLLVPSEQRKKIEQLEEEEEEEKTESQENQEDKISQDGDASVNVIPYPQDHIPLGLAGSLDHSGAISATLHRIPGFSSIVDSSSTPIAFVYTPTMRPPIRRPEEGFLHGSFERAPVLLQSQHAAANSGPAAPQSFMAPFVASASAEAPAKNGWSVVMPEQPAEAETMDRRRADSNIRSDGNNKEEDSEEDKKENSEDEEENTRRKDEKEENVKSDETEKKEEETQTEKSDFNVENFTPQLFGGFKPIFEFPSDGEVEAIIGDKVSGGALGIERPRSGDEGAARKLENV